MIVKNWTVPADLLRPVDLPYGRRGSWRVEQFVISPEEASLHNLRETINGRGREIEPGVYTGLWHGSELIMSDTPAELEDHREFLEVAWGDVLVLGLGLGLVVQALCDSPKVRSVTVVEKAPEVIELVGVHYAARYENLTIHCGDALTWRPASHIRYDAIWLDIWTELNPDYAKEMARLKHRYRHFLEQDGIVGAWCEEEMFG